MGRKYTDNALTTLASSITAGSTTLSVPGGKGDLFPAILGHGTPGATPDYFIITMENASLQREKIRVENRASGQDTLGSAGFPLVRGFDGTTAQAWNAGDLVDLRIERTGMQDVDDKAQGAVRTFGVRGAATSGLNFGFYGGPFLLDGAITTVADGAVALTASQTNFVERNDAGGVTANTTGFSADKFPLYIVVTDGSGITSFTDQRSEILFAGRLVKSVAGGVQVTLTAPEARNELIELTGVISASINVVLPVRKRQWVVKNSTTGAFNITVKTPAGTGIVVPQGTTFSLYGDGVNILDQGNNYRFGGRTAKSVAGSSDVTLTDVEVLVGNIALSGVLTGNISVIVPTIAREWIFQNSTTGAFSVTIKTLAGVGVVLPQGSTLSLYCDANDVFEATTGYRYKGRLSRSVAGSSDVTLTAAEARNGILDLSGILTGNINIIVPTDTRDWLVKNGTTGAFTLTVKTAAGAGVVVSQGVAALVYCDGTNVLGLNSSPGPFTANFPGNNIAPSFETGEIAFAAFAGATSGTAHGLGVRPRFVTAVLRCISSERGWITGDEMNMIGLPHGTDPGIPYAVHCDAANVYITGHGSNDFTLPNRDGGGGYGSPFTLAGANWRVVIRAWK